MAVVRRARQTSLALDPPKERAGSFTYYAVGGWPEYSQFINPATVPLCDHRHGEVDPDLMRQLMKKTLVPQFFRTRCLTADWRGHRAGTRAITYGSDVAAKFDLWIGTDAEATPG